MNEYTLERVEIVNNVMNGSYFVMSSIFKQKINNSANRLLKYHLLPKLIIGTCGIQNDIIIFI